MSIEFNPFADQPEVHEDRTRLAIICPECDSVDVFQDTKLHQCFYCGCVIWPGEEVETAQERIDELMRMIRLWEQRCTKLIREDLDRRVEVHCE